LFWLDLLVERVVFLGSLDAVHAVPARYVVDSLRYLHFFSLIDRGLFA
jgi:hypothetical protein